MSTYRDLLKAYLDNKTNTQTELAEKIRRSQAAVNRYANGLRFPDSETARAIDNATSGAVPFQVWQVEMAQRVGIGDAA